MAKSIDATYNPSQEWTPIEEGTYPAHIASLNTKDVHTKAGEAIVVNMTYKIADEAADMTQQLYQTEGYKFVRNNDGDRIPLQNGKGKPKTVSCGHIVGRTFYDNGWFIFTQGSSSGKNRRYFELLDKLGVECTEEEVDGKTHKKLVLLEEGDVIGKPVQVTIHRTSYITRDTQHLPHDQQEKRTIFKVKTIDNWTEGSELSEDELSGDVPF
tara:strand:+ start:558 stop:1193 length:636 start_codon:yes stop_codon:yes gene_type:complete